MNYLDLILQNTYRVSEVIAVGCIAIAVVALVSWISCILAETDEKYNQETNELELMIVRWSKIAAAVSIPYAILWFIFIHGLF